ncbi:MAG TPA: OstA-like protein, partial [Fibrobacteraceae bacterium]|nr:OstA-like protein [Fibrobacteraceae bacterium]
CNSYILPMIFFARGLLEQNPRSRSAPLKSLLGILLCCVSFVCAQTKPLMMEHADSLSVTQERGMLLLKGHVRFRHDSASFQTEKATWNKRADVVHCDGGFLFLHPKGSLKANTGEYRRKDEIAEAVGNVEARDSSGEGAYFGERVLYYRQTEFLDLKDKPLLHYYSQDTVKKETDTLWVRAKHITYDRKNDLASAFGNVHVNQKDLSITCDSGHYQRRLDLLTAFGHVRLTQKDLVVTCDTGWFDHKNNQLTLVGHPKCLLKENQISGDSMFVILDGEQLKSVRVIRNAIGIQDEKPKNGGPLQHTQVNGDTLFAEFEKEKMKNLYVSLNAQGQFWEADLQDYINRMSGQLLTLTFQDGQMQEARVTGGAKSTYWYVEKKRTVSGRNEAAGDTISVLFDTSRVSQLQIRGAMSSGIYYDLSKVANKDSTKTSTRTPFLPFSKLPGKNRQNGIPFLPASSDHSEKAETTLESK